MNLYTNTIGTVKKENLKNFLGEISQLRTLSEGKFPLFLDVKYSYCEDNSPVPYLLLMKGIFNGKTADIRIEGEPVNMEPNDSLEKYLLNLNSNESLEVEISGELSLWHYRKH